MHPLRILILAILVYILYRLLVGRRKISRQERNRSGQKLAAHDVLVEDPVCHTYVPKGQAVVYKKGQDTYYFCSEKCQQTFVAEKRR